jgi:hypothetical protein
MEYAGGVWYSAFAVSAKNASPFCAYHLPETYPSYRKSHIADDRASG